MLHILWGSQSGNARNLAQVISDELSSEEIENTVLDMGEVDPSEIFSMKNILIVTSTYGDGEAPDNASNWHSFVKFEEDLNLSHLHYAVLGLGDTYYPHFCQCGKDFDEYLSKRGALALLPRIDCDLYYEEQYGEWLQKLISVLKHTEP
ncbi:MAG: flavodoxin domain-containing protein [Bacteriovoracaceae bacterium]